MNRREVIAALGATVGGLTALNAASAADAPAEHMHMEHMLKCAKACADCQLQCDSCFAHCLALLTAGKKDHAETVQTCADCAEACKFASSMSARQSPFAVYACEACAKSCDDCATSCEKFKEDKHMAECAKACRDCAKACREMIKHMKA